MPSSDYADDEDDDEEQEVDSEVKEDGEKKPRPSWTVVCSTEEEWQQLAESFKKSKNKDEKMLYETLSVDFVPEIGKMIEAKVQGIPMKVSDIVVGAMLHPFLKSSKTIVVFTDFPRHYAVSDEK